MGTNCAKWLEAVCATPIKSAGAMTAPQAREQNRPPLPPDRRPPRRGGRPSSETCSAAGRPDLARLAGARRALVGSARALAAAALLALTGVLALPATAEAQTIIDLVSNVGQRADSTQLHNRRAQVFTTGSNPSGYILTGVDVVSASSTGLTAKVCGTNTGPTAAGFPHRPVRLSRLPSALRWERCPSPPWWIPRSRKKRPLRWCWLLATSLMASTCDDETFTVTLSSTSNATPATSSRATRSPAARMRGSS